MAIHSFAHIDAIVRGQKVTLDFIWSRTLHMDKYETKWILRCIRLIKTWSIVPIFVLQASGYFTNWLRYWHINWILIFRHCKYMLDRRIYSIDEYGLNWIRMHMGKGIWKCFYWREFSYFFFLFFHSLNVLFMRWREFKAKLLFFWFMFI